jgi:nucleoside-diphosphate-sugar epimerase
MKKVLITGGTGFVGTSLAKSILSKDYDVHILIEPNSNLWRLQNITKLIAVHEIDLLDFEKVKSLIKNLKPELIFHLASFGGMPNQLDQKKVFGINFYGTVNLLNASKSVGFECFINTGSSSEYGIKNTTMAESTVLEPVSDYGVSKAAATQFCLKEAIFNKLPIYTLRPFSVYGDFEMPTRLIPSILCNATLNKQIKLSCRNNVRDFVYIQDVVDCYLAIAEKNPTSQHIFNAGTGVQSTIQDVVETTEKLFNKKLDVVWDQQISRPWEPKRWQADISKSKSVLGWKPKYGLENGLKKSLEWFEKNIDLYKDFCQKKKGENASNRGAKEYICGTAQ